MDKVLKGINILLQIKLNYQKFEELERTFIIYFELYHNLSWSLILNQVMHCPRYNT